jgi:hypothetical protein
MEKLAIRPNSRRNLLLMVIFLFRVLQRRLEHLKTNGITRDNLHLECTTEYYGFKPCYRQLQPGVKLCGKLSDAFQSFIDLDEDQLCVQQQPCLVQNLLHLHSRPMH